MHTQNIFLYKRIQSQIISLYFISFQVCQRFFLATLGYTGDSVLRAMFAKMTPTKVTPPPSKRGKHDPKHKLPQESVSDIKDHVMRFNPACSHYRRAHAPNRLYLPPELTVKEMYADFSENGSGQIHYSTYQKIVNNMNISFAKLGEEECETCEAYRLHEHDKEGAGPLPEVDPKKLEERQLPPPITTCTKCHDWAAHIVKAGIGRNLYREDAKKTDQLVYAADLEKVIMLPRLPGNKTAIFTRRIIVFNETFAPVGGHGTPLGYLWHEGIRGRNDEDISSTYIKFLSQLGDAPSVIIWADNCTAQNKNWTLYSALLHYVNQVNPLKSVTLRYFEKGHTFMAADSFHKDVEGAMRHMKKMYDFDDFVECVNKHGKAVEMKPTEFSLYKNHLSRGKDTKFPHLSEIVECSFKEGSTKLFWKTSFAEPSYSQGEFVQKKYRKFIAAHEVVESHLGPRGVNKQKQKDIVDKLSSVFPQEKLQFWLDVATSEDSADLTKNYE